jgi:hypothetical protein
VIGASRTGGHSARFTGSKCRSRVWISLFAKPILARVADPIVGRTYERKRSDRRSPNLSLQVGGRPHMNRAADARLGHTASIPCVRRCRSPEALALGAAVIACRRRYHCPERGCLLNRSRNCSRLVARGHCMPASLSLPLRRLPRLFAGMTFTNQRIFSFARS